MAATRRLISRRQTQRMLGVGEDFLLALEEEAIVVREAEEGYTAEMVERIRVCQTLHDELGVNLAGLEVALQLLDTIHAERSQFRAVLDWLHAELGRRRR